jgi:hypothetical protein
MEHRMIIASRIPGLTEQMLRNTRLAAEAHARGVDWMTLAELDRLERRWLTLLRRLDQDDTDQPKAA